MYITEYKRGAEQETTQHDPMPSTARSVNRSGHRGSEGEPLRTEPVTARAKAGAATTATTAAEPTTAERRPTEASKPTLGVHVRKDICKVHATHAAHPNPRFVVFAEVVPLSTLRVGQDGVRLGDEFEFLFVAALVWVMLQTLSAVRFLDLCFCAISGHT